MLDCLAQVGVSLDSQPCQELYALLILLAKGMCSAATDRQYLASAEFRFVFHDHVHCSFSWWSGRGNFTTHAVVYLVIHVGNGVRCCDYSLTHHFRIDNGCPCA